MPHGGLQNCGFEKAAQDRQVHVLLKTEKMFFCLKRIYGKQGGRHPPTGGG
jgi:hypothetical protein